MTTSTSPFEDPVDDGDGKNEDHEVIDDSDDDDSDDDEDEDEDEKMEEILGASTIHQQKNRDRPPLVGQPDLVFDSNDYYYNSQNNSNSSGGGIGKKKKKLVDVPDDLLRKRQYPSLLQQLNVPTQQHPSSTDGATTNTEEAGGHTRQEEDQTQKPKHQQHSELEHAVLMDCLSSNFMFSHLSKDVCVRLCTKFEKIHVRKNEIIRTHGNDDDSGGSVGSNTTKETNQYLYVLYLGDVQVLDLETGMPIEDSSKTRTIDPNCSQVGEKYQLFGELEFLTDHRHHNNNNNNNNHNFHLQDQEQQQSIKRRKIRIKASSPCILFRLSRRDYVSSVLLRQQRMGPSGEVHDDEDVEGSLPGISIEERIDLLKQSLPNEIKQYFEDDDTRLRQLARNTTVKSFKENQVLVSKGMKLKALVIIAQGVVQATNVSSGGREFEDVSFGPNEKRHSFGWHALLTSSSARKEEDEGESNETNNDEDTDSRHHNHSLMGTIVASSDGTALVLSQTVFRNIMGPTLSSMKQLAIRRQARIEIQQISIFQDSELTELQYQQLLNLMHRCEYSNEEYIFKVGQKVEAAMYFIREGSVKLLFNKGESTQLIEAGGYFGEKNMLKDQNKERGFNKHWESRSLFSAIASSLSTVVDVLTLEECRSIVDTTLLGLGKPAAIQSVDESIEFSHLTRHTLLGAGSFGQAWLATVDNPDASESLDDNNNSPRVVALKIQPKHEIARFPDKGYAVVAEKNLIASLNSPFVIRLLSTFQDHQRLFLVMKVYQGGELESLIPHDGMSEHDAKFYAAGILEGLSYLHKRHIIHRDVKPENCLIDEKGYPVLCDFGFAKYVPDKTFTFCGSPMLTAPEVIRYKGHDRCCDYWSWAVVVYRLATGRYPFYEKGMDELALYKRICQGKLDIDGTMSVELRMLLVAVLYPDPAQRLGSRVNGWRDIFSSPWFGSHNDDGGSDFDLRKLRNRSLPAPWVPTLKDPLDTSRFQFDWSNVEDMMKSYMPGVTADQQKVFENFGPHIGLE